jgi:hypothetical protein
MDISKIEFIAATLAAKEGEDSSTKAGEKMGGSAGKLCKAVADRFKGDAYAEQTLARAREKPDSAERLSALKGILAEKMNDDPNFAQKMEKLVQEAEKEKEGSGSVFDQRGQTVHGAQTNIAGNVHGPVFSGQFSGPVAMVGEAVDMRDSVGAIYKPSGPVNQHIGDKITRSPEADDPSRAKESAKKIKALFLASNPKGTTLLQLGKEIRTITEKIQASEYRDSIDLISAWAVRPDDLLQLLNQHRPQIVHFSGHGSEVGEIILEDSQGALSPVSPKALKALFTALKDNIRLVILNACYSKTQAKAITQVIDCAIGMNDSIGDPAAIVFAASFYRAIGFGRSIKQAFDQGVVALQIEGIPEEQTPELLTRKGVDPAKIVLLEPMD